MGERAVIDKGMETLAEIGQGESTKFILRRNSPRWWAATASTSRART